MNYKGYSATFEVDTKAGIIHGEVLGLRDVLTFQAASVPELEREFEATIDDYLAWCAERGEKPDRPFSGQFMVRVDPQLHRTCSAKARRDGVSLNAWVAEAIKERCDTY